jgi:hypothetical protein
MLYVLLGYLVVVVAKPISLPFEPISLPLAAVQHLGLLALGFAWRPSFGTLTNKLAVRADGT